jgi:P-type Cu+ transporter
VRLFASLSGIPIFTLIAMGMGAAYVYSLVVMFAPVVFPAFFRANGKIGVYFEAAAVITVLVLLGKMLDLAPRTARVVRNGEETEVPLDQIVANGQLRFRPGETVPVDGLALSR